MDHGMNMAAAELITGAIIFLLIIAVDAAYDAHKKKHRNRGPWG